jgi:cytochrome P450
MVEVTSLEFEVRELFEGRRLDDPYPIWQRLREEAPVYRDSERVVVSRYADLQAMLPDRVRYRSDAHIAGTQVEAMLATFTPEGQRKWHEIANFESHALGRLPPKDHDRLRRIAHRYFTPRQIQKMEDKIQGFWDELTAEAAAQEVYDHKHLSQSLALRVITDIVGCPDVDAAHVASMVERLAYFLVTTDEEHIVQAYEARLQFNDYIDNVILDGYRRNPDSNEFVRALMDAEGGETLSPLELSALVSELLFGGTETSAVLLSSGLLTLLQHRDQWEWLCEDPVPRVPPAVEELFRYVAPAQTDPKTAAMSFELDGVEVPEGYTVVGSIAAAHRDPAQYENPDTLDITRGRPHLGLGIGPKFCLGASVIRTEARIAFTTLAQRYPEMQLAVSDDELDWSGGPMTVRSLRVLPIALGAPSQS